MDELNVSPVGAESETERGLTDLAQRVTGLRRWVIALSIVSVVSLLASCSVLVFTGTGILGLLSFMPGQEVSPDQIEESIRKAYGPELGDLEVREVRVDYGEGMLLEGLGGMPGKACAVEYSLKGSDVTFASFFADEMSLGYSGFVPVQGSLSSRMTTEQLMRLLEAWADETDDPVGGVRRYSDSDLMMMEGSAQATITLGAKEYSAQRVWVASEGARVKDDTAKVDAMAELDALVFYENPKTGAFEFIGREPGAVMMPF